MYVWQFVCVNIVRVWCVCSEGEVLRVGWCCGGCEIGVSRGVMEVGGRGRRNGWICRHGGGR